MIDREHVGDGIVTVPSPTYGSALFPQHQALLAASGIDVEVARERGYRSIDVKSRLEKLGFGPAQRRVPGLLLPVWSVGGEVALHQYRPDDPRRTAAGKVIKYETPRGASIVVDVHPRARAFIDDPCVPLFVTEGVRKADAAVSRGLCCVGLLGVWSWRGTNTEGGRVALPDWESIALNGRTAYICFDSDVMLKAEVHAALVRLRAFLQSRSADVALVYLPPGPQGQKLGLDDYLASGHDVGDLLALATTELRGAPDPDTKRPSREVGEEIDVPPCGGEALLDALDSFIARFVIFSFAAQRHAIVLWILHAHALEAADTTPRLSLQSAQKQSGKSRVQEVLEMLVPRPLLAADTTVAAMFRAVAAEHPTLLLDEVDAVFGPKARGNEELRALINAGHRRNGSVLRCVGEGSNVTVERFPVFAATALAGIGRLPDTITDRSIVVRMKRKTKKERVEKFKLRTVTQEAAPLRAQCAAWAKSHLEELAAAEPGCPDELSDRQADSWEPLLALADVAGGPWPERARSAALQLSGASHPEDDSLGMRLLSDLQAIFSEANLNRITSADLVRRLVENEEAPWGDLAGKPLDPRRLATLLRDYDIRSKKLRMGSDRPLQGYEREMFQDAFDRYLPPGGSRAEHPEQPRSAPVLAPEHAAETTPAVPDEKTAVTCGVPVVPLPDTSMGPGDASRADALVSGTAVQHAISLINDAFGTAAHDWKPSSAKQPALPYGAQAPTLALLGQPCPACRSAPYLTAHDGVDLCQPCAQRVGRAELIWDSIVQTTRAQHAAKGELPSKHELRVRVRNGDADVDEAELERIIDAHARDWDALLAEAGPTPTPTGERP